MSQTRTVTVPTSFLHVGDGGLLQLDVHAVCRVGERPWFCDSHRQEMLEILAPVLEMKLKEENASIPARGAKKTSLQTRTDGTLDFHTFGGLRASNARPASLPKLDFSDPHVLSGKSLRIAYSFQPATLGSNSFLFKNGGGYRSVSLCAEKLVVYAHLSSGLVPNASRLDKNGNYVEKCSDFFKPPSPAPSVDDPRARSIWRPVVNTINLEKNEKHKLKNVSANDKEIQKIVQHENLTCVRRNPFESININLTALKTNGIESVLCNDFPNCAKTSSSPPQTLVLSLDVELNDPKTKAVKSNLSRFKFQRIKPQIPCHVAMPISSAVKAARAAVQRSHRRSRRSSLGHENILRRIKLDEDTNVGEVLFKSETSRIGDAKSTCVPDGNAFESRRVNLKGNLSDKENTKGRRLNPADEPNLIRQSGDEAYLSDGQLKNLGEANDKLVSEVSAPPIRKGLRKICDMKRRKSTVSHRIGNLKHIALSDTIGCSEQISVGDHSSIAEDDVDFQRQKKISKIQTTRNGDIVASCSGKNSAVHEIEKEVTKDKYSSSNIKTVEAGKSFHDGIVEDVLSQCSTVTNSSKRTFPTQASKLARKVRKHGNNQEGRVDAKCISPVCHISIETELKPLSSLPVPIESLSLLQVSRDKEFTKLLSEQDDEPVIERSSLSQKSLDSESVVDHGGPMSVEQGVDGSEPREPEVILIDDNDEDLISLDKQIESVMCTEELTGDQIRHLVFTHERFLRDIFEGKTSCQRHIAYRDGGTNRRALSFAVVECLYNEEQRQAVMAALMQIFCKNHSKYFDYLLKVLVPEMLVRLFQLVQRLEDRALADQRIMDMALRRESLG